METTPHYKSGEKNHFTMIFSCPGKAEKINNHPVSGMTGVNLNKVIKIINEKQKHIKLNFNEITITNAWKIPIFGKKGITEAKNSKIKTRKNTKRVYDEIKETKEIIFVFGLKAKLVIEEIKKYHEINIPVIYSRHLSLTSLNQLSKINLRTTQERLDFVANHIINQINDYYGN